MIKKQKLENIRIEGTVTALSQIHHGGNEKTGSCQLLRRQKFFVEDDEISILLTNSTCVELQFLNPNGISFSLSSKTLISEQSALA